MKQNRILLNNAGRNHIKIFPLKGITVLAMTEQEKLNWCEQEFNKLLTDKNAVNLLMESNKRKGYLIAVWELDNKYYLVMSIRTAKGIFNNTIYIGTNKDDMLAIAKFLKENIEDIAKRFKEDFLNIQNMLEKIENELRTKSETNEGN